jgi:hypothetical protein
LRCWSNIVFSIFLTIYHLGIYTEGFMYFDANGVNLYWQYFGFQYHSNLHTMQEPSQPRQNRMNTNMVHNDTKLNSNSHVKIILSPSTINNDNFFNTIIDVDYHLIPCNHLHTIAILGLMWDVFDPEFCGPSHPDGKFIVGLASGTNKISKFKIWLPFIDNFHAHGIGSWTPLLMLIVDTMQTHVHETQFQLGLMRDVFWTPSFVDPVVP